VFPAYVSISISCYTAWYSGTDYVVAFSKGINNCCVPYKVPASVPRVQGQKPSGLLPFVKPMGSKIEGRPMQVNDLQRIKLMAERLGKQPAFLMQKRP